MGGPPAELIIAGSGSIVVATDEMLADVQSMHVLLPGLDAISALLKIADAYCELAVDVAQVGAVRVAVEQAAAQLEQTKGIVEYLGPRLETAIADYSAAEAQSAWLASAVDPLLAFLLGLGFLKFRLETPGADWVVAHAPWMIRDQFADDSEAIEPTDVEVNSQLNALLADPQNIDLLRNLVMQPDAFILGAGGLPRDIEQQLAALGVSGVAATSALLMLFGGLAGLLTETDVAVRQAASTSQQGPTTTGFQSRFENIPDPAQRSDGAQIRIDTIYEEGEVRYEVFVAGTADFSPISAGQPFDFTSNVAGVAGQSPASYRAVELAMQQAGISAGSPVSFTGYSQGGLVATMLAASGNYNTQGLVTMGAPAGQVAVPSGFPAVIIENLEDPIPALGGTQSNDQAVLVSRQAFSESHPADFSVAVPGHQFDTYLATTALMDDAESAVLQKAAAELNGFSSAGHVVTTFYTAERVP